jgi:hypothetical protein
VVTITQERQRLAAIPGGPKLRRREQWGARFVYTSSRPVEEPATRVFVHITVTNPGAYSSNDAHARAIENIGINRFPATGISYNRGVMPDGSLYEFQPMGRRGAHTVNDFKRSTCSTTGCPGRGSPLTAPSWNLNVNSRAYVICQNVQHTVSDKQLDNLARAIAADKLAGLVTKNAAIHGHRCVSSKSCPGDRMWSRMGELNQKVSRYVANGFTSSGGVVPPPPVEEDMPLDAKDAETVWTAKLFKEYVDENADGTLDARTPADILYSTHKLAYLAATPNIDALAAAIVAKFPNAGSASIDVATVKAGVIEALREGVGDAPA